MSGFETTKSFFVKYVTDPPSISVTWFPIPSFRCLSVTIKVEMMEGL